MSECSAVIQSLSQSVLCPFGRGGTSAACIEQLFGLFDRRFVCCSDCVVRSFVPSFVAFICSLSVGCLSVVCRSSLVVVVGGWVVGRRIHPQSKSKSKSIDHLQYLSTIPSNPSPIREWYAVRPHAIITKRQRRPQQWSVAAVARRRQWRRRPPPPTTTER